MQVRERDLEASALAAIVGDIMNLARGSRTRVVVNDRVDVALACSADGVHLSAASAPAAAVRAMTPRGFVIGRSVHSVADAVAAGPVDYLVAGTVWPTASKPPAQRLLGIDGLEKIVRAVPFPVLAIGGITRGRLHEIARTGAAGAAGIALFMDEATDECRAAPLLELVAEGRAV